jgi:hydrogenase/urease accessory protein HupE
MSNEDEPPKFAAIELEPLCRPMTSSAGRARLAAIFGLLLLAGPAHAHPLAPSLLQIEETEPGRAEVLWKTPLLRVPGSDLRPVLPEHCRPAGRSEVREEATAAIERWTIDCRPGTLVGGRIAVAGIPESRTDVLLRIVLADGRAVRQVLHAEEPSFVVPERERPIDVLRGYVELGIDHILTGPDHLLFVLGLVLLVPAGRRLFWTVTAFTLGHSLTLSLAVLGFVHIPPRPVEALIALSILVLAVELTRPSGAEASLLRRYPWAMAASFGLLHGLGFAGALAEVGLPAGEIPLALFSFNAGIEIGQVGFVVAVLVLGRLLAPIAARVPLATEWVPPYVIGSLAAFWLFERVAMIF